MIRGKRGPGSPSTRRRWAFQPINESLEDRRLLATIDLTATQTTPYGVESVGKSNNNTAGYTVTDVGDINGSGYDSYVVSAPGLSSTTIGGTPVFGAAESAAYLVFGSKEVNVSGITDYLSLAAGVASTTSPNLLVSGQRASDLGTLGTLNPSPPNAADGLDQTNPTVQQPTATGSTLTRGFNFDGLTLVTGLDSTTGLGTTSGLGFSVSALGDLNSDGYDDFAISAPNDTGGGKVFVIYGGANLTTLAVGSKTIDLDSSTIASTAPTDVISFSIPNAATGTDVGYSVAGIGNYFNTTTGHDLAIGVPGLNSGAGGVYAIPGNYINNQARGTDVNLTTLVATQGTGGILYTGINAGDLTGTSVSTAGNFDGQTGSGSAIDDLLIGAPGGNKAYLVYALQDTAANNTLGTTQPLLTLGATPGTNPVTTPLQGIVFSGGAGERFGFSVATAGDFNVDGIDDVIVGAPGYLGGTGAAEIFDGLAGTSTTTVPRINGTFFVEPTSEATGLTGVSFIGAGLSNYLGYSVAPSAHIAFSTTTTGTTPGFDVLIGAPGGSSTGSIGQGTAYLIPGSTTLVGTGPYTLTNSVVNAAPLNGTQFIVEGNSDPTIRTNPTVNRGFGTSVNARNPVIDPNTLGTSLDGDNIPDLFFGAPFTDVLDPANPNVVQRSLAGIAYAVEGSLIGGTGTGTGTNPTTGTGSSGTIGLNENLEASLLHSPTFTGVDAGLPFPPVSSLEHLSSYAPLPVTIAYQQYRVAPGFLAREEYYHNPKKGNPHQAPRGTYLGVQAIHGSAPKILRVHDAPKAVFTKGKFKHGETITFTHKVKVIPRADQTEKLTSS